jgi:hypothetical protein
VLGIIERRRIDLATITLRHAPDIKPGIKPTLCRSRETQLIPTSRTGEAGSAQVRFDSINIEADRITNSVNTLAEQIMQ